MAFTGLSDGVGYQVRVVGRNEPKLFDLPGAKVELLSHYNALLFAPAALVRIWSKWFPPKEPAGDVATPPSMINRTLQATFSSERHILGRAAIPFGLSLIAVVRREAASPMRQAA